MVDRTSQKETLQNDDLDETQRYGPDHETSLGRPVDDATGGAALQESAGGTKDPEDAGELSDDAFGRLTQDIIAALKTVYDPEIPSDIYELGLIYRVDVSENRDVEIDMTLTAPACPVAEEMPIWVENAVSAVPGVGSVKVNVVFDPPWDMSRMSDEARLALNMF